MQALDSTKVQIFFHLAQYCVRFAHEVLFEVLKYLAIFNLSKNVFVKGGERWAFALLFVF